MPRVLFRGHRQTVNTQIVRHIARRQIGAYRMFHLKKKNEIPSNNPYKGN